MQENNTPAALAPGMVQIPEGQYQQLTDLLQQYMAANAELKTDIATILQGFGKIAGIFGGKTPNPMDVVKMLSNPTKLMETMGPTIAVMAKYQQQPEKAISNE